MKKFFFIAACAVAVSAAAWAQSESCNAQTTTENCCNAGESTECCAAVGTFDVQDFGNFKLHTYLSGDQMDDASFIIEGADSLVTMEQPLFKANAATYDKYIKSLGKPVAHRISDFHLGNTGAETLLVPAGMTEVFKGPEYSGMMAHFANQYGDAIVALPTGKTEEVAFDTTVTLAGVPFTFTKGASNDFPGADILIGKDVVYMHFAPAKAHTNALYASSVAGVEARIAELEQALATGAKLFVGSHGLPGTADDVRFLIDYLKKVQQLRASQSDAESFVTALTAAYPGLPGADGLGDFAKALYAAE
jgi:hypothetical protein